MINYDNIKLSELNSSIEYLQTEAKLLMDEYVNSLNEIDYIDASLHYTDSIEYSNRAECLINIRNVIASRLREKH